MSQSKNQRRKPFQTRSKATVDTLIEAAARVFSTSGFEATTTNAIAEMAGVSVGSLYQYFPDKLALLDALHQRHIIGLWQHAGLACQKGTTMVWPEALRYFVAATFAYNQSAGPLFSLFQKQLPPRIPTGAQIDTAKVVYEVKLHNFLIAHQTNIRVDINRAAYMIPVIGKGVVTNALLSDPDAMRNVSLIDELTKVLHYYLCTPESSESQH